MINVLSETYENLIKNSDYATFFHTPMWLDTVKYYWGYSYFYEHTIINNKKIFFPLNNLNFCNRNMFFSTYKGYGGLLSDINLNQDETLLAIEYLLLKYKEIKIRDNPLNQIILTPIATNIDYTYIIDKLDYSFDRLRNNHKRNVKIALNYGVEISEVSSIYEWKEFYLNCYMDSVKSWLQASIIYNFEFFEYLRSIKNNVSLVVAKFKGKIVSGCVLLKFNQHIHYWISGVNSDFKKICPNHLLITQVIQNLKNTQFRYLDLGVSGNNQNLIYFKSGFNSKKVSSNQYISSDIFDQVKKNKIKE